MNVATIEFYKSTARAHMRSLMFALECAIQDDCDPGIIELIDHYSALIKEDFESIKAWQVKTLTP